ncbi:hypothetical protein VQ042_17615 [Aurantimonas sp. A2-1-M11]|uniref:hypothetical protein n=1 Tax=Aurantimonas sp. A2-1-M11 TaxID=3113712 RepID=UPI002F93ADD0
MKIFDDTHPTEPKLFAYRVEQLTLAGTDGGTWFFSCTQPPGILAVVVRMPDAIRLNRNDFHHVGQGWHDVALHLNDDRSLDELVGCYKEMTGKFEGSRPLLEIGHQVHSWATSVIADRLSDTRAA